MRHLHGGQKHNFRERMIVFDSHSFKQIMMNTFKVLQMNNSTMQIKKKSSYVGFFFFMNQTKALKWDFRNYAEERGTSIS